METIVFTTEEKNEKFKKCLEGVFPEPFIVEVRNENCGVQLVSLFNIDYYNPGVTINTPFPKLSYPELCRLFHHSVTIGLFAVRILQPHDKEIMSFMRFDFTDNNGRNKISHEWIHLYDDPEIFEPVMFQPMDITFKPLTHINFDLPRGAEIEIMLFEKKN